jgi:Nucleotidyl transferase AbiEii toxin, Type IV TA system
MSGRGVTDGGRLRPRVDSNIGPILHPDDLAADKVLALWGRARPRDFYDVAALLDHHGPDRLIGLASAKDAGFSTGTFVDALRAIARLTVADWAEDGINPRDTDRLYTMFADWQSRLATSE